MRMLEPGCLLCQQVNQHTTSSTWTLCLTEGLHDQVWKRARQGVLSEGGGLLQTPVWPALPGIATYHRRQPYECQALPPAQASKGRRFSRAAEPPEAATGLAPGSGHRSWSGCPRVRGYRKPAFRCHADGATMMAGKTRENRLRNG
jgi:hypothetical protein